MSGLEKKGNWLLILGFLFPSALASPELLPQQEVNILFYNTENFFDFFDDPNTLDEEFLPQGSRFWDKWRFERKRNALAKVIIAAGQYNVPAIAGLAEVENRFVLESLTGEGPLSPYHYGIIHKDSPDERGIDVALIYRPDIVRPFRYDYFPLRDEKGEIMKTREILYAGFTFASGDTLHVFFNHWPPRYQGQAETDPERMTAAMTLRQRVDKLNEDYHAPLIVIMGDFNDQPRNRSLTSGLNARFEDRMDVPGELINLSAGWRPGTLKYRESWQVFDQIIVSDFLLKGKRLQTKADWATIIDNDFLLEPDPVFKGKRLNRTYLGYRYQGGVSDHLPVKLKLLLNY
jgi:endonuclease/exonuclease/phosphatase family metal-dependent hydrolase